MRNSPRGDALDRLEYVDRALLELARTLADETLDGRQHGDVVELFMEHLAIRVAAHELVADGLAGMDELRGQTARLRADTAEQRAELARLEELGRAVGPTGLDQGQDVATAVAGLLPALCRRIDGELGEVVPEIRRQVSAKQRSQLLPTARDVVRHASTRRGMHRRRWYERISPIERLHMVYGFLGGFPGSARQRPPEARPQGRTRCTSPNSWKR